jgi:hypothetical protein
MKDKLTISQKEAPYWANQLNCKVDAIRIAKAIVGNKTADVKAFIESHRGKQVVINPDVMWLSKEG